MGFKVGNIVKLKSFGHFSKTCALTIGKEYEVTKAKAGCFYVENDNGKLFMVLEEEFILFEKVSKNKKRIEHLENVVSQLVDDVQELHLIIHGLRGKKDINITTNLPEEEIIEFEGNQYRKVDREAREGDVIIARESDSLTILPNTPYKVTGKGYKGPEVSDEAWVYETTKGRTLETVDVYEPIEQPKGEAKEGISNEQAERLAELWSELKTVNQQRAEIIEKAKVFVEEYEDDETHFVIDEKAEAVVAWKVVPESTTGVSVCSENKVFNEHIQKAIALGRMKAIDVSEFENAVQPDEVVAGMIIRNEKDWLLSLNGPIYSGEIYEVSEDGKGKNFCQPNSGIASNSTIINDTNAEYEVAA